MGEEKLKETKKFNRAIGTLGGGNHFIEVDADEQDNKYLVIHTGSRNMGKQVADYYQNLAIELCSGKEEMKKAIEAMKDKLDNDENSWFYYDEIETIFDLLEKQNKEIERLYKDNYRLDRENQLKFEKAVDTSDYVNKDKIREKIKDLSKEEKKQLKGTKGQDRYSIKQEFMYKRSVLEELL